MHFAYLVRSPQNSILRHFLSQLASNIYHYIVQLVVALKKESPLQFLVLYTVPLALLFFVILHPVQEIN
jgi:hypothetical protein